MSAHFVHLQRRSKSVSHSPLQPSSTKSPVHHIDRPHTSDLGTIATPLEILLLFVSVFALLALVIWLAWIALSHCVKVVKGKMDDLDVGQQTKKTFKMAKEGPKKAFKFGIDVGRTAKGFFDGMMNGGRDQERRGRREEGRGLLRHDTYEERVVTGKRRGIYTQGYGYDRERFGDGTADTSSQSKCWSVGLREDGEGPRCPNTKTYSVD